VLDDNRASIAVSSKLGYRLVDRREIIERGCRYTEGVYQVTRTGWLESSVRRRYCPVFTGVDGLVGLLER
jgi:RimJ/RimL family protein N-acetyltransferase